MVGITAVVHTYNSEKTLYSCLESLVGLVDEILVCDMYSTDATVPIAEHFNATVIYHEYTGLAESARDYAVRQAQNDWVFILDSDETAPKALLTYLRGVMAEPEGSCDGVLIPCQNIIWGKPLRAAYPDHKLRFFRKAQFHAWPTLVHRGVIVHGPKRTIPGRNKHMAIQHQSYGSIDEFIEKMNRYTRFELTKLQGRHRPVLGFSGLGLVMVWRPTWEFFKRYILKAGFRDGFHGFVFAVLMAQYKLVALTKLWHKQWSEVHASTPVSPTVPTTVGIRTNGKPSPDVVVTSPALHP